jgi:predicted Zn-dependent protease
LGNADKALARREHRRGSGGDDAISVWIAYGDSVPKYRAANRDAVRDAFHSWTAVGVPLRFIFVSDSARATVRVVWRELLPASRAGQVTRAVDSDGWLHSAVVELATRSNTGEAQDKRTMRAVALHEVGHLIGLEHSGDPNDVMAARVRARELTDQDRETARMLYGVGTWRD